MTDSSHIYLLEHLRQAMAEDDRVSEPNIRVTIAGGRVWLNGQVGSEERRKAAEVVAREIATKEGMEVRNDITVMTVTGPTVETLG